MFPAFCGSDVNLSLPLLLCSIEGRCKLSEKNRYNNLGFEWATSLLAFLSLLLLPIPFVYFYKGEALRWRSPSAREHFDQKEDSG